MAGLFDEALASWRPIAAQYQNPGAYEALMRQAGLWDGFTSADTSGPREAPRGQTFADADWSRLNGYQLGTYQQDYNLMMGLRDPQGNLVGTDSAYNRSSLNSSDYAQIAAVLAAGAGGAYFGGGGVSATGVGASAGATEAGIGTLGTIAPGSAPVAALPTGAAAGLGPVTLPTIGEVASVGGTVGAASSAGGSGAVSYPVSSEGYGTVGSSSSSGNLPLTGTESVSSIGNVAEVNPDPWFNPNGYTGGNYGGDFAGTTGSNWGTADNWRSGISILSGIYGLSQANKAQAASDPFGPYRGQYAQQLSALEANPSSITQRPGYRAGIEGVRRILGSRGYLGSGNEAAALMDYSGNFYNNEANRLAQLAGAGIGPGNSAYNSAQLKSQSLASIGYGLAPVFGALAGGGG